MGNLDSMLDELNNMENSILITVQSSYHYATINA